MDGSTEKERRNEWKKWKNDRKKKRKKNGRKKKVWKKNKKLKYCIWLAIISSNNLGTYRGKFNKFGKCELLRYLHLLPRWYISCQCIFGMEWTPIVHYGLNFYLWFANHLNCLIPFWSQYANTAASLKLNFCLCFANCIDRFKHVWSKYASVCLIFQLLHFASLSWEKTLGIAKVCNRTTEYSLSP